MSMAGSLTGLSLQPCVIASCRTFSCPFIGSWNCSALVFLSPGIYHASSRNNVSLGINGDNCKDGLILLQEFKSYTKKREVQSAVHQIRPLRMFGKPQINCELHDEQELVDNVKIIPPLPEAGGETQCLTQWSIQNYGDAAADANSIVKADNGAGQDGIGGGQNGNFGGGDDGHDECGDDEEDEFGPILNAEEVFREANARGVDIPSDMVDTAKTLGISKFLLFRYLDFQEAGWPLGMAIRVCPFLRNRMLADPSFLFKVLTEIAIESGCATFAEVQKRGKDFWEEFELYLADLLVGIVVGIALVGLSAPFVSFGQPNVTLGISGRMQHTIRCLPSSVFEAERPGRKFSIKQRIGTHFYKGLQYGTVGFLCGIIGQGIANSIMILKRKLKKSEEKSIRVPPLLQSAALWGVFLAVSSNTRYQIVNGLETVVERSPLGKSFPPVALAFTVGIRFANNVYAGMQFVDWARWAGVQ